MKTVFKEDISKFSPCIEKVIDQLGNGAKRTEFESGEITVGDTVVIANVVGYWVQDILRIDIKFRNG
jgi:hypothetical protein